MKCLRCGGVTWEEIYDGNLYFNCLCGAMTPDTKVGADGIIIIHAEVPTLESLPRKGSKLSICLGTLASIAPATTKAVADMVEQTTDDTASQLTVLRGKGLVERVNEKKGVAGGSIWRLTQLARQLLNI